MLCMLHYLLHGTTFSTLVDAIFILSIKKSVAFSPKLNFVFYRTLERCPTGFYFDFEQEVCAPSAQVACERCPEQGVVTFPVDGSCMDYLICVNGQELDRTCAVGARFDPTRLECVPRELVECEFDVICPEEDAASIIEDPNTCEYFIICQGGLKLERRRCADGLLFDPDVGRCVRAADFVCPLSARKQLPWTIPVPKATVKLN